MVANTDLILAVLRSRKKFDALRLFTLESGEAEIERQYRRKKDGLSGNSAAASSNDSLRSPTSPQGGRSSLQDVPEEDSAFAIGEDDDDSDGDQPTRSPVQASRATSESRAASISSSVDETVPLQLRGMSEKARGKMPAGAPSFSRQNSSTSLGRSTTAMSGHDGGFDPTTEWVSRIMFGFGGRSRRLTGYIGRIMGARASTAHDPYLDSRARSTATLQQHLAQSKLHHRPGSHSPRVDPGH